MHFKFSVQDEVLDLDDYESQIFTSKAFTKRAIFVRPKNFINKLRGKASSSLWKSILIDRPDSLKHIPSEIEIKNINAITDIEDSLEKNSLDLLLLETTSARYCLSSENHFIHKHKDKEACAPRFSSVENTEIYKKVNSYYESKKLTEHGDLKWANHIKPILNSATTLFVVERHLASYLFGKTSHHKNKHGIIKRKEIIRLLKEFKELENLKEVYFFTEYVEKDFKDSEVKFSDVPNKLKGLGKFLLRKNLKINFFLGPAKFFQAGYSSSKIFYDKENWIFIDHFGNTYSEPEKNKDFSTGKTSLDEKIELQQIINSSNNSPSEWKTILLNGKL